MIRVKANWSSAHSWKIFGASYLMKEISIVSFEQFTVNNKVKTYIISRLTDRLVIIILSYHCKIQAYIRDTVTVYLNTREVFNQNKFLHMKSTACGLYEVRFKNIIRSRVRSNSLRVTAQ